MKISFRFPKGLYKTIQTDLSRPHQFAGERVGFVECGAGATSDGGLILLAEAYNPVDDSHYIDDPSAGATINSAAFRAQLQRAYHRPMSVFHIHRHEHFGAPRFSPIDLTESRKFVPDFFKVQKARSHGVIVLSHDSGYGLCWTPGERDPVSIGEFVVVGRPIERLRND